MAPQDAHGSKEARGSAPPVTGGIDDSVPHSARIWTYWLGGKDFYPADRAAGEQVLRTFPGMRDLARSGRYFLGRLVGHLVEEAGVRQFLDVGTGLPTVENTHEVAQRLAPSSRIVYVDNDPLVLVHAQALLTSASEGATAYIDADVHDPERILQAAADILDFDRPVALMLMGILAHVEDYAEARDIVRRLMAGLPPGSYLAVRDGTTTDKAYADALDRYNESGAIPYRLRAPGEIAAFFEGLDMVEPGLVPCPRWRPDAADPFVSASSAELALLGGLARKP